MAPSRQTDNWNIFLWFQDLASSFSWSVSRPAEVWPWEVRFAHPCRARARHPIHKAMGGHASHGHTSDRAFIPFQFREGTLKHYGRARLYPVCFSIPSGAIRTQQRQMIEIDKHSRFNSIMVQLEPPTQPPSDVSDLRFNSIRCN